MYQQQLSSVRIFLEVRHKIQTLVDKGTYTKGAYLILVCC